MVSTICLGLLLGLALTAGCGVAAEASAVRYRCMCIGHRGGASLAPENTLAAFRAGIAAGADACELDVHRTSDGKLIVIHNNSVRRTTNGGNIAVAKATLAELRQLDAGHWGHWKADARFAGLRLPTLEEALNTIAGGGAVPVVEVKVPGTEDQIAGTIHACKADRKAWVISFHYDVMCGLAARHPDLRTSWLVDRRTLKERGLAGVLAAASEAHCQGLDCEHRQITPELVAAVHAAGLKVQAWTVDRPSEMERLIRMGVDAITTNRPQDLKALLERMNQDG